MTVLQSRKDQVPSGGRAIKLTVKANIEGLPVIGLDQHEIILSIHPACHQKQYNNQTELRHDWSINSSPAATGRKMLVKRLGEDTFIE